ncbi:MAG: serine/threonine protein kinase [Stappia sp.]|uniref:HPr kinase/phosphorylase n=1 Tax=Stappia sp. TaxID=1870903 RepID=UPI000C59C0F7|nr:serine/threonine protein kinase [Stappia sp.]MAA99249.1 serine/threonine protein kinase [Stappia sp.]MBM19341.1 serine/threonine protein kinase [Stappia sp.]
MSGGGTNVHASCVLIGASGVLLRGGSGAGKSRLGDLLVLQARAEGRFAAHVADDRVELAVAHGRVVATAPHMLSGLWERRGEGICRVEVEPRALLRLVVDLENASEIERMPDEEAMGETLLGVRLPRLVLAGAEPHLAALRILTGLGKA